MNNADVAAMPAWNATLSEDRTCREAIISDFSVDKRVQTYYTPNEDADQGFNLSPRPWSGKRGIGLLCEFG